MRYESKQALIDDVRTAHDLLCARLREIPKGRWHERGVWGDGWTVSDLVAHLAEWQQMFLRWYEEGREGATPRMPAPGYKWSQTPKLNRAIWKKHRSRSTAAVRADFDSGYVRILQLVKALSPEQLLAPGYFTWTGKHPLATYLGPNTASHYRFAIKVINRWLKSVPATNTSAARPNKGLAAFCLCFLIVVIGGAQVRDLPSATESHGGFGLPDQGGNRLMLIPNLVRPELLTVALCGGGRRVSVQFERRQVEGANDGRQTGRNFDKLAGSVYAVLGNTVEADGTCFLASEALLAGSAVLSIAAPEGPGACLQSGRFATLRDRRVVHCWPLAQISADKQVALLEFERRGKEALASLVFVDGSRTMFADVPAEFRGAGEDVWSVDDGGVLSPDRVKIVCALQRGGWYALGTAWQTAEGRLLSLWISDGSDRFTKVINDYWYQAPR